MAVLPDADYQAFDIGEVPRCVEGLTDFFFWLSQFPWLS